MRRGLGTILCAFVALGCAPAAHAIERTSLKGEGRFDAVVRTTSFGIPHILARDFKGLGYGYGWALARANICTLADTYATVRAERSRFFGPDEDYRFEGNGVTVNNLNSDFFFQRIIDTGTVEKLLAQPPPHGPRPEIRAGVRGYVAGYNRWLRDTGVDNIPDPTCRGKPWVKPIEEIDAYRRFYQLALLASSGVAIDGIAAAQPLIPGPPTPGVPGGLAELGERLDLGGLGSNAYGLGAEQTTSGHGMVLGNPHFPWQGAERFFQSHLTVPGRVDVAGASLMGVPIVLIGHTKKLGWSHTVSTARRFTIFELKLVPGSPTTYLHDGQPREMIRHEVTVELGGGERRTRTLYSSHHGPVLTSILGLPLFPWTSASAFALGDVNAPNFRYLNHFFETNQAQSVNELDAVLRRNQGIPWVNTIAADSGGNAYYADLSVVPHVTDEHAQRCNTALGQTTWQSLRVAVLDGSRADCEWGTDPDALQPGTFGPGRLPHLFRRDYVTNSNDSHWLSNPEQPLEGFDLIVGDERTARALRTRVGLLMAAPERFTLRRLREVAFGNRVYAGELFRDDLVRMCEQMPGLADACAALRGWDLKDDLDSPGAVLFRRFAQRALASAGGVVPPPGVFREPFDPADPVNTPRGLNTESPAVRQALEDAVQDLRSNGIPLDARLRDYQSELRGDERIPIHGGPHLSGVFNVITAPFAGRDGFPDVNHGSSFVMAAHLKPRCPDSRSILTYSQAATDTTSPHLADQTHLYSRKRWVDMRFCAHELLRDRKLEVTELGCVNAKGFRSVRVRMRGGRIRLRARRALRMPVRKRLRRTGPRRYVATFAIRAPSGRMDRRRVAFRIDGGRVHVTRVRRAGGCRP